MNMQQPMQRGIVSLFNPYVPHLKETYNPRKVDKYIQRVERLTNRMLPGATFINSSPFGGMGSGVTPPFTPLGEEPRIAEPGESPFDLFGPGTASPYGGAGNPIPGAIYGFSPFAAGEGAMGQGIGGLGPIVR